MYLHLVVLHKATLTRECKSQRGSPLSQSSLPRLVIMCLRAGSLPARHAVWLDAALQPRAQSLRARRSAPGASNWRRRSCWWWCLLPGGNWGHELVSSRQRQSRPASHQRIRPRRDAASRRRQGVIQRPSRSITASQGTGIPSRRSDGGNLSLRASETGANDAFEPLALREDTGRGCVSRVGGQKACRLFDDGGVRGDV